MRQVAQEDAGELARLIHAVGLDDNPNEDWIARVILNTSRITLVEEDESGALAGFVDGFMTVSADGVCRWEVDLLGVHPSCRGRGIAQRLIAACVQLGREQGAAIVRALIHLDNAASAGAFRRCGFLPEAVTRELYVSDQQTEDGATVPVGAHLIPVCTLTYSGVWLEGEQTEAAQAAARAVRAKYDWLIVGALLPAGTPAPTGFVRVGAYRWWTFEDGSL